MWKSDDSSGTNVSNGLDLYKMWCIRVERMWSELFVIQHTITQKIW